MSVAADSPLGVGAGEQRIGPHPSYIEVAQQYILQSKIQAMLRTLGTSEANESATRLQGITWIDSVRRALSLPVRTFDCAAVYYHKFRLLHKEEEYNWADAAAAALFTACKIEDTLKKSREILCKAWELKFGGAEMVSSDDPRFDTHSKIIIGLERLMLESSGFDFRTRYPQGTMIKIAKTIGLDVKTSGRTAWYVAIDLYRTWAPLKQTAHTMAISCIELAARLHELSLDDILDKGYIDYNKWSTSRAEIMETLLDLLDLYTHHRAQTSVGPLYPLETFINIRITLNQEASAANIPRYTLYACEIKKTNEENGAPKLRNGIEATASPFTPTTPNTLGAISPGQTQAPTSAIGIRGQSGTVRFMLDAVRARNEQKVVESYYKVEEEEYEVQVPDEPERRRGPNERNDWSQSDRGSDRARGYDRDERGHPLPGDGEYEQVRERAPSEPYRGHSKDPTSDRHNVSEASSGDYMPNFRGGDGRAQGQGYENTTRGGAANRGRGRGHWQGRGRGGNYDYRRTRSPSHRYETDRRISTERSYPRYTPERRYENPGYRPEQMRERGRGDIERAGYGRHDDTRDYHTRSPRRYGRVGHDLPEESRIRGGRGGREGRGRASYYNRGSRSPGRERTQQIGTVHVRHPRGRYIHVPRDGQERYQN